MSYAHVYFYFNESFENILHTHTLYELSFGRFPIMPSKIMQ